MASQADTWKSFQRWKGFCSLNSLITSCCQSYFRIIAVKRFLALHNPAEVIALIHLSVFCFNDLKKIHFKITLSSAQSADLP